MRAIGYHLLIFFLITCCFSLCNQASYEVERTKTEQKQAIPQSETTPDFTPAPLPEGSPLVETDIEVSREEISQSNEAEDAISPEQTATPRKLIRTGTFKLAVERIDVVRAQLVEKAQEFGGDLYDATLSVSEHTKIADLKIRIPSDQFDPYIAYLQSNAGDLWEIRSEQIQTEDVTEQFTDLSSRIHTLEHAIERLNAILDRSGKIQEVLQVEQAIIQRITEKERIQAQLRVLVDKIDLSTIHIHLTEDTFVPVQSPEHVTIPFEQALQNFSGVLTTSTQYLFAFLGAILTIFAAILPWLIVLGIIGTAIGLYFKFGKRKKPQKNRES